MVADGTATYYVWDGLRLLETRHANGELNARLAHGVAPIEGIGSCVAVFVDGGGLHYLLYDHRGSAWKLVDGSGNEVYSRSYSAFGEIVSESGTWPTGVPDLAYQTNWLKLTDMPDGSPLYLSPTRIYHAGTGRFLQRDRLEYLNKYVCFTNCPMSQVDPRGLMNADTGRLDRGASGLWEPPEMTPDGSRQAPPPSVELPIGVPPTAAAVQDRRAFEPALSTFREAYRGRRELIEGTGRALEAAEAATGAAGDLQVRGAAVAQLAVMLLRGGHTVYTGSVEASFRRDLAALIAEARSHNMEPELLVELMMYQEYTTHEVAGIEFVHRCDRAKRLALKRKLRAAVAARLKGAKARRDSKSKWVPSDNWDIANEVVEGWEAALEQVDNEIEQLEAEGEQ